MEQTFIGLTAAAWTAIGTMTLVAVTAVYVRKTGNATIAARRSAAAAERIVLLELAPIVVLRNLSGTRGPQGEYLGPEVENVARSVALGIHIAIESETARLEKRRLVDVLGLQNR